MRFLLASSSFAAVAAALAVPAAGETVISTATTTPLNTSAAGDIRVTSTGSIKPTGGAAVTISSNNSVKNEGTIAIKGANGAAGIVANANVTGSITNSGTITIDEDYTAKDADNDGDLDGPFAQGTDRYGIHVLAGGTFTGNVGNTGTITVEGNQSAGIAIDSALAGAFSNDGKIAVVGNDSVGVRVGDVSGSVTLGGKSAISVQGQNSVGVMLGGDIGGALVIQGSVTSTGYRSTTAPSDTSKLDADDLLQGGSAVVLAGNAANGLLFDGTSSSITTYGSAPALMIGSASRDISLGAVPASEFGHGIYLKGTISGIGVYNGVSATGMQIGGAGYAVNVAGGMSALGSIVAQANGASATGLRIGSGASVPQIVVGGKIIAEGGGTAASAAQAILIDAGATVNALFNSGTIAATRTGDSGTAAAIVDRSGTLALVQNSGAIGVTNSDLGDAGVAIDLSANTSGAVVRQIAAASGRPAPVIAGKILLGTGNDTLDIQVGSVLGNVDFGGGADLLSLTGASLFRGGLANSGGVTVNVGTGSTLDVKNLGAVNLASLTTASGANLGVTIGEAGHTLYSVAGTATFGADTKILVTLDHVGSAAGTYTIIDAGTLVGADNLSGSIVTLPFLFDSKLTPNAATGEVALEIELKGAGELGLNRSETAILDAALDAADEDRPFAAVFLKVADAASLKGTLQQLMPDHAGGAFETAIKGSRLSGDVLGTSSQLSGLWLQQVAWGSSKSIGATSSYKLSSWGASGGYDYSLGALGSVGLTAGYFFGKDGRGENDLISNHYEGGAYWRGGFGPLRAWARATAGTIDFESKRNFTAVVDDSTLARVAEGKWKGRLYSALAGLSYEARMGRLSIRPNASIEYYKLSEKGYAETGGGEGFNLTVRGRKSNETAANALLSVGYDLLGMDADATWMRLELEGGRREILSGSIGKTVASFGDGDPFTLAAEDRTSGWRGGLRLLAGGSSMSFAAEANAEEQQGHTSIGGRVGVNFAL